MRLEEPPIHANTIAFGLLDDEPAGAYLKDFLVKFCRFPFWVHPWFETRGQHIYYPVGELAMEVALAYDIVYDLMTEEERRSPAKGCSGT